MNKYKKILITIVLSTLIVLLTSCDTVNVYQRPGYGPPAHAKAHGYRNKQPKAVVVLDVQD